MIIMIFGMPLILMSWASNQSECVGGKDHLGDLSLGYLSMMFTVVQTATTVGFGDSCTAKLLLAMPTTLIAWLTIFLISWFVLFLAFFRNAMLVVARWVFVKTRFVRRKVYDTCCPKVQGHCCGCAVAAKGTRDQKGKGRGRGGLGLGGGGGGEEKEQILFVDADDDLPAAAAAAPLRHNTTSSISSTSSLFEIVDDDTPLPISFVVLYVAICFMILFLLIWPPFLQYECFPEIERLVDCLYFVVTTITTVGYGDIVPAPTCVWGRIMTIVLMSFGSSLLLTLLTEIMAFVDLQSENMRIKLVESRYKSSGLHDIKQLLSTQKYRDVHVSFEDEEEQDY